MSETTLAQKVELAWFRKTGEAGGWNRFQEATRSHLSQESIARDFDVTTRTSVRWHREYREMLARKTAA